MSNGLPPECMSDAVARQCRARNDLTRKYIRVFNELGRNKNARHIDDLIAQFKELAAQPPFPFARQCGWANSARTQ
jgi:hypothetical protein